VKVTHKTKVTCRFELGVRTGTQASVARHWTDQVNYPERNNVLMFKEETIMGARV
jgi:hypothetical protein